MKSYLKHKKKLHTKIKGVSLVDWYLFEKIKIDWEIKKSFAKK